MSTVSVVAAAWRGEAFIAEQLRSLFRQTRPPDEIVLGDDDPGGGTAAIAEALRSEVPAGIRLRVERNPLRLGLNANFRRLMFAASGELIFFCDQDDVWLPRKIELMERSFAEHPDAWLIYSLSEMFSGSGRGAADAEQRRVLRRLSGGKNAFPDYLTERMVVSGHDMAIRRELLRFVPEFSGSWLYDCWLVKTAAAMGRIYGMDEILCRHRLHDGNAANRECWNNASLRSRFSRVRGGGDEIAGFLRSLLRFKRAADSLPLPEENREFLNRCLEYFTRRVALRRRRGLRRLAVAPELLYNYFTVGNGLRSLLRDILMERRRTLWRTGR